MLECKIYVLLIFLYIFNVCVCENGIFNLYEKYSNVNREELVVTNIENEENFNLELNVRQWRSLPSISATLSVGIMNESMVLIQFTEESGKIKMNPIIKDVDYEIEDVRLFQNENWETFAVVSSNNPPMLKWYNISNTQLDEIWTWYLVNDVYYFDIINMQKEQKVLVLYNQSMAEIYDFHLPQKNFWVFESIVLKTPASSASFIQYKWDFFLIISQNDYFNLYKYQNNHFSPYKNIACKGIKKVVTFEIGFKAFVAVDGLKPTIYGFTDQGLEEQSVKNSHLNDIKYWKVLPVIEYRDDAVLLAQRIIQHGTHNSSNIELLTFDGESFIEHDDIPCNYFGEDRNNLNCLIDEDTENSIQHIAPVTINDRLALLVPYQKGNNVLFMVEFNIVRKDNPVLSEIDELLDEKRQIEEMLKVYESLPNTKETTQQLVSSSLTSKVGNQERVQIIEIVEGQVVFNFEKLKQDVDNLGEHIDVLKARVNKIIDNERKMNFESIVIEGSLEASSGVFETVAAKTIFQEKGDDVLEDIVRTNELKTVVGKKIFSTVSMDNLNFGTVNGIDHKDFVYKTNNSLEINNNVVFTNNANVDNLDIRSGILNGLKLKDEIVVMDKVTEDTLHLHDVLVEGNFHADEVNNLELSQEQQNFNNHNLDRTESTVFIPQNVTVKNINGESLDDFINKICLKNLKCYIPNNFVLDGDILVQGNAYTDHLNEMKFPEDFAFTDESQPLNITGKKTFENLEVSQIRISNQLNNQNINNFITLSTPQHISSTVEFEDLEVTEELNINGKIVGKHLDKFLSNPVLSNKVTTINANVNFKSLIVEGTVIVENNYNNLNYHELLTDKIYKDEDFAEITGFKEFPEGMTVRNNLQVESNIINNIHIDEIITKDTDQILNLQTLNGTVGFGNLNLGGLYGSKNVTKIDQESVKLSGEQYISSTLFFNNNIEVNNLEITQTLNDLSSEEYLFKTGDRTIESDVEFDEIVAENMTVENDMIGNITSMDLDKLRKTVLSYSSEQEITGNYTFTNASIVDMVVENINEVFFMNKFDKELLLKEFLENLMNNKREIRNLHVHGSLEVDEVNNNDMSSMIENLSKMPKNIELEDVYFTEIDIDSLCNVPFDRFVEDVIFKNESSVEISGRIEFTKGIRVKKLIETKKLNEIRIGDILTKYGEQNIQSAISVHGDVHFEDVSVLVAINERNMKILDEPIETLNDTIVIRSHMVFERLPHIMNLTVNESLDDILTKIVFINDTIKLDGHTVFTKPVNIEGNLKISEQYNNLNISEMMTNVVLTTKDSEINGPVHFKEPAVFVKNIQVENLKSEALSGFDMEEWKENALFINKGLLQGKYKFEDVHVQESILTETINNIDMKTLIPLRTEQEIPKMFINDLHAEDNIRVEGLVSGYKIRDEVQNSLTVDQHQEINSKIVFQNDVMVEGSLFTSNINNIPINQIVTTNTDQDLTASYKFLMKCHLDTNLNIDGTLNGINITSWNDEILKSNTEVEQDVMEQWNILGNMTLEDDVNGGAMVNNKNLQDIQKEVNDKIQYKFNVERAIIDDYNNLCKDVENMYELSKHQIYKFRYFDELQTLKFERPVSFVKHFEHKGNDYLLVNEENNCQSHLMVLFNSSFFNTSTTYHTGSLSQVIFVDYKSELYFVTVGKKKSSCDVKGTNVWKFTDGSLQWIMMLDNQIVLQESLVPGTFYGLNKHGVTEYKINNNFIKVYRKWKVSEDNMSFVPRGFGTGLAVRNGKKLIKLHRDDPDENTNSNTEFIIGKTSAQNNRYIPGRKNGDLAVTSVGPSDSKRNLLAVASHEEVSVKGPLDSIIIYSDPVHGKIFHKIATYKPSSLLSVDFDNGETLLMFMENNKTLQIYEYKGINGFQHRVSAKIAASKLFQMTLPLSQFLNKRKVIGAVNGNKIVFLQSSMSGNQIRTDMGCKLQ